MSADATEANQTLFEIPGARPGEVPETDPLWYLLADHLVPHYDHARKIAWIEGFVSACEAARGRKTPLDISGTLRETLAL